jgi:8-oxo-dGTP pyrophosphatase MutT (NUDIX family)
VVVVIGQWQLELQIGKHLSVRLGHAAAAREDPIELLELPDPECSREIVEALRRELREELGISADVQFEGPVAIVDSIAPKALLTRKHVVHIIFAADLSHRSLEDVETKDAAIKGARLFSDDELEDVVIHPPIKRFLTRWEPGDPAVYLGALWAR